MINPIHTQRIYTDTTMEEFNNNSEVRPRLTPAQKLKATLDLYWSARELKKCALHAKFPDLSEEEINERVKKIFLYASE